MKIRIISKDKIENGFAREAVKGMPKGLPGIAGLN